MCAPRIEAWRCAPGCPQSAELRSLALAAVSAELRSLSLAAVSAELRPLVLAAVSARLRSPFPPAVAGPLLAALAAIALSANERPPTVQAMQPQNRKRSAASLCPPSATLVLRDVRGAGASRQRTVSSIGESTPRSASSAPAPREAPASGALVPLRSDAPARSAYRRGSVPDLTSSATRERALEEFTRDLYAASGAGTRASRIRTISRLLAMWSDAPLPLSSDADKAGGRQDPWWASALDCQLVQRLGASLKAGGYRSAGQYLSIARQVSEAAQGYLPAAVHQALKGAERSCNRGLGPAKVCQALPLERFPELPGGATPWTVGGPISPRCFLTLGSWFLTREIELSTARAVHVSVEGGSVTWLLPADKTDPGALGKERTLGCSCASANPALCPTHCFLNHLQTLKAWFPQHVDQEGRFSESLPLFPDSGGEPVTKQAAVATIERAATLLGLPLARADGVKLFTGHTLRPTGAQAMGRAGMDPWLVGLWGRWGSATVMSYLRDAPLAASTSFATRTLDGLAAPAAYRAAAASSSTAAVARKHAESALVTKASWQHTNAQLARIESRLTQTPTPKALEKMVAELKKELEQATFESLRQLRAASDEGRPGAHQDLTDLATAAGTAAARSWLEAQSVELRLEAVRATPEGRVHAILSGELDKPRGTWRTWCGWAFGNSATAARCHLPLSNPKLLCRRCLPEARGAAERKLAGGAAAEE